MNNWLLETGRHTLVDPRETRGSSSQVFRLSVNCPSVTSFDLTTVEQHFVGSLFSNWLAVAWEGDQLEMYTDYLNTMYTCPLRCVLKLLLPLQSTLNELVGLPHKYSVIKTGIEIISSEVILKVKAIWETCNSVSHIKLSVEAYSAHLVSLGYDGSMVWW